MNDRELVTAFLRRRDDAAFRDLYRRHAPALFAFALRLAGGRSGDAEDLLQETWIRAAARLDRFEWHSALRTWLGGILVNCWRERIRALDDRTVALDEASALDAPPRDAAAAVDLDRAIAGLPDRCRAVLILHDIEGYTHEEIGVLLGVEPGTSKSQLSRARRTLRAWLGGAVRPAAAT